MIIETYKAENGLVLSAMKISIFCLTLFLIFSCLPVPILSAVQNATITNQIIENSEPHNCRFWGMIAHSLPEAVVLSHLINATYSLKNLGATNSNGWGLAYYNDSEPVVLRGELPANIDDNFNLAAQELARSGAHIGVGHVRLAASGASDIPNPHPFIRYKGGKWWAFGHNGVLSKTTLKNLIGSEYLAENPPTVGNNWNDSDVVDSDLYMLYILKCTEESGWNATQGIARAVTDISKADFGGMNFFLTDSETLWGFRKGNTLYYYFNETEHYSAIASQPPTDVQDGWIALNDYNLVILTMGGSPSVIEDIIIIPEFSITLFVLPLLTIATLVIAVCQRKISEYIE